MTVQGKDFDLEVSLILNVWPVIVKSQNGQIWSCTSTATSSEANPPASFLFMSWAGFIAIFA